jgi:hypothetical protein
LNFSCYDKPRREIIKQSRKKIRRKMQLADEMLRSRKYWTNNLRKNNSRKKKNSTKTKSMSLWSLPRMKQIKQTRRLNNEGD